MRLFTVFVAFLFCSNFLFAEEKPSAIAPQEGGSDGGFDVQFGISAGAAVLDGELYNQIGIRPLITIGKLGIALDLSLYLDADGNIREENWDEPSDFFEKLYYVRWAQPGDPFYVKVGAIDNYRLGYGLLMNRYSNTIEYPTVIRTGMELGLQGEHLGFQGMVNNFAETFDGGGVVAGRLTYKLLGDLEIGISAVADINQYKGLKDKDEDGVPDFADDFPNKKRFAVDTDGDGVPDENDPDVDGDGYTDNSQIDGIPNNDPDGAVAKGDPFNIKNAKEKGQLAFAADIAYPFIKQKYLTLIAYSQFAQFANDGGWGVTAPGVMAKFAFINAYAEYRIFDEKFIPEYFNTTYELERAVPVMGNDTTFVVTKRQVLESIKQTAKGYVIGADFNIADFLVFGAEYQDMIFSSSDGAETQELDHLRTLRASLDLNANIIPKVSKAGAYFYQNNTSFNDLFKRSEGTVLGYRLGYDIGGGATLLLDFRQTYRDLNGDGKIKGSNEVIKTTLVQTVFMF